MTPLEKLKAIAAAKKAAQAQEVKKDVDPTVSDSPADSGSSKPDLCTPVTSEEVTSNETDAVESVVSPNNEEPTLGVSNQAEEVGSPEAEPSCDEDGSSNEGLVSEPISGLGDDHPLKMQLAELEQALLGKLPEFRTILRDIHSKLRADPDCVTAMSEDEIGVIVSGLIHHANVEIIAPKAVKAAKAAAKKTPISASDL